MIIYFFLDFSPPSHVFFLRPSLPQFLQLFYYTRFGACSYYPAHVHPFGLYKRSYQPAHTSPPAYPRGQSPLPEPASHPSPGPATTHTPDRANPARPPHPQPPPPGPPTHPYPSYPAHHSNSTPAHAGPASPRTNGWELQEGPADVYRTGSVKAACSCAGKAYVLRAAA